MSDEKRCAQCGTVLAADAPQGLCPACLLKRGFATGSSAGAPGQGARTDYVPPTPAELARYFPELEILELIGRGGMGAVYKARQKGLDRLVALKILPFSVNRDPAFAERFGREARALARLTHPNIVTIHSSGQADGLFYFVMEFVDGLNLRQLLNSGKIAPKEALAIVPQICDALQYAHDKGIVHRDIKPENILLAKDGKVKIADFGLAKLMGVEAKDMSITDKHDVMGTPHYMAPEQVEHPQDVDHRADIYSLGVVFYQMLTGELPIGRFAPPSRKVQIDVRLDEVVLRALEKEPELRYQQASVLKTEVETIATTPTIEALKDAALSAPKTPQVKNEAGGRFGGIVLVGSCNGRRVINWSGVICAGAIIYGASLAGLIVAFGRYVPLHSLIAGTVGVASLVTAALVKVGLKLPMERLLPFDPSASRNWSTSFPGRSLQEREICAHLTAAERNKMGWLTLLFLPGNMVLFFVLIAFVAYFKQTMDDLTFTCAFVFLIALLLGWLRLWSWKSRQFLCSTAWARKQGLTPDRLRMFSFGGGGSQRSETARAKTDIRPPGYREQKKPVWWLNSPLASPEVQEIVAHMTPAEKRESLWLGAMFGIWNAATWFAPLWVMFFMAKPLNNWKLAVAVWAIGILFYPVWYRIIWKAVCSTQWAQAQGIKPESLRKFSFAPKNLWKIAAVFGVFILFGLGMAFVMPRIMGIPKLLESMNARVEQNKNLTAKRTGAKPFDLLEKSEEKRLCQNVESQLRRAGYQWKITGIAYDDSRPGKLNCFILNLEKVEKRGETTIITPVSSYGSVNLQQMNDGFWLAQGEGSLNGLNFTIPSPKTEPATTAQNLAFGPVVERVINDVSAGANYLMDIDTGIISSLPPSIKFDDVAATENWYRKTGIDVSGKTKEWPFLCGRNLISQLVRADRWDNLTADELNGFLERNKDSYAFPGSALGGSIATDIPTFLFKTSEGGMGILQLTGFTDNPRGVKIRYKLVQTSAPTPPLPPGYEQGQEVPLPPGYARGQALPSPPAYNLAQNPTATRPVPPALAKNLSFGPVIERMVNLETSGPDSAIYAIDFDTSQLVTLTTNSDISPFKNGADYLAAKGADVMGFGTPTMQAASGLSCINNTFAMTVDATNWDNATADWVKTMATKLPLDASFNKAQLESVTVILVSEDGVLPKTFLFKTGAGGMGLLQITGFTDNLRAVKIRYKLVQSSVKSR